MQTFSIEREKVNFLIDSYFEENMQLVMQQKSKKSTINTVLFQWTWRELNPRPKALSLRLLPSQSLV